MFFSLCPVIWPVNESLRDGLIGFRFVSEASGAAAFPFQAMLFTFRGLCHDNFVGTK